MLSAQLEDLTLFPEDVRSAAEREADRIKPTAAFGRLAQGVEGNPVR